jgi:Skp family chaperone for outer membrane proteins
MRHLVVLACLLFFAVATGAETALPAGPTGAIAVLNLEVVLNNAKLFTSRMEAVKRDGAEAELQLKKYDKDEKELKSRFSLLAEDKPERAQLEDQLDLLRMQRKKYYERTRAVLEKQQAEVLAKSYEEVRGHLTAFAEEHGLKLVLLAPSARISTNSVQEVLLQLGQQSVLHHDASLDVTESFVAYLNGRFAATGGTAAPAAPAVPAAEPATEK